MSLTPVERVERIEKETKGVTSLYGLKDADKKFMRSIKERQQRTLSVNQEKWLADIEEKVFEEAREDED